MAIFCIGVGLTGLLGVAYCTWMQRKGREMHGDVKTSQAQMIDRLRFQRWRYVHGDLTEYPEEETV